MSSCYKSFINESIILTKKNTHNTFHAQYSQRIDSLQITIHVPRSVVTAKNNGKKIK